MGRGGVFAEGIQSFQSAHLRCCSILSGNHISKAAHLFGGWCGWTRIGVTSGINLTGVVMTPYEARARVARGAAHLDVTVPGWADRIDVGTLTLHDTCHCIIGQLAGQPFDAALRALSVETDSDEDELMGFDCELDCASSDADYAERRRAQFQPLQDAWLEAIADRRMPSVTSSVLHGVVLAGALCVFLITVSVL